MLRFIRRRPSSQEKSTIPLLDSLGTGPAAAPRLLILSSAKKNQNYYRDYELACQTRSVFVAEDFDFARYRFDITKVIETYFGADRPDFIFINYNHGYTYRLKGFDGLGIPVLAFVGDHYDFLEQRERARVKQEFYRSLPLAALVTAYPHTNEKVLAGLGIGSIPFIYLPWAIDAEVFHDLGRRRRYDIACLGAHTEGKYPLRRQVRAYLEQQKTLKFFRKQRVCSHDGVLFNKALNKMRSCFTCASVFGYTLMKYFEIPAAGALLFAEQTRDLEGLGFRDGVNYVRVGAEDFADKFHYYLSGDGVEAGERIRRAGNRFVREKHTWSLRIRGFLSDVERLG